MDLCEDVFMRWRENMKLIRGNLNFWRRLTQVLTIILFGEFYSKTLSAFRMLIYTFVEGDFQFSKILGIIIPVALLTVLTIFFGRIFCGWFCVLGALNDVLNFIAFKIFKKRITIKKSMDSKLKYIKYAVLICMLVMVWSYGADNAGILKTPLGRVLIIIFFAGMMFIERFFCRFICPLGAVQALLSFLKLSHIHKDVEKCGNCSLCSVSCPMKVDLDKKQKIKDRECIVCLECINVCPKMNTTIKLLGRTANVKIYVLVAILIYVSINIMDKILN